MTKRPDPLEKQTYSKDSMGNHLPDFSHVGYHSGEKGIPHVPVKMTLEPSQGDDTLRIQDALDKLGTFPLQIGFTPLVAISWNPIGLKFATYAG